MSIERYNCNGHFHEAVIHNDTIYLSGQVATKSTAFSEQAKEILDNLNTTLEKYGSDKNHIISANVILANIADFAEFNKVWDMWCGEGMQPVRTCYGGILASPKFLLEITLIAAVA